MSEEESVVVTPEVKEEAAPQVTPQPSEAESIALEQGWVPKDQWKGDPDDWRPAKEFNDRGELFTRIKSQSKELSELRQAMTFLTEQQKKQFDAGYQQAVASLKSARNAALEEGDMIKAQRITDRLDEVKDQQRAAQQQAIPKPAAVEPTPAFKAWFSVNNWYTKDKVLTKFADAEGFEFKNENPECTEAEMLAHVSKVIKKEFPNRFAPKGPPSPDGEGRGGAKSAEPSNSGFRSVENGMTEEQRTIMKTILKSTGMTKEQYFKQYAA
jgi:hypothetical protein